VFRLFSDGLINPGPLHSTIFEHQPRLRVSRFRPLPVPATAGTVSSHRETNESSDHDNPGCSVDRCDRRPERPSSLGDNTRTRAGFLRALFAGSFPKSPGTARWFADSHGPDLPPIWLRVERPLSSHIPS